MEAVRHDTEQAEECRESCSCRRDHHTQQLPEIVALGRCHQVQPSLDPLQRPGGRAGDLFQYGDPGFHVARISAAAEWFNGNIRHVLRSMVNHRELDAIG